MEIECVILICCNWMFLRVWFSKFVELVLIGSMVEM